jgi:hypothetical protein
VNHRTGTALALMSTSGLRWMRSTGIHGSFKQTPGRDRSPGIDQPGLYSWWADQDGAAQLSEGVGFPVFVGRRLSAWMREHLSVAVYPYPNRDALADLEDRVLEVLDPPLNLEGMPPSTLRARLSALRSRLGRGPTEPAQMPDAIEVKPLPPDPIPTQPNAGRPRLHEEIADILRDHGKDWMSTAQIAAEVNRRGRYHKRDGSAVSDFQVHGRTRNYALYPGLGAMVRPPPSLAVIRSRVKVAHGPPSGGNRAPPVEARMNAWADSDGPRRRVLRIVLPPTRR